MINYKEFMKKIKIISNITDTVKSLFKKNKKLFFLTIALIFIMLAVFVSTFFTSKNNSSSKNNTSVSTGILDYTNSVENKLESMLLSLSGISSASVFVMVEATPTVTYLTETEEVTTTNASGSSTTTKTTTVVFEKDGSISTPITVTTILPKVTGVMVVLNKVSPSTKLNITNAIATVLNIDVSCISILQES